MQDMLTNLPDYNPLASVGKRWLAAAIDYGIFGLFIFGAAGAISIFDNYMDVDQSSSIRLLSLVLFWIMLYPCMEAYNNGKTIGKAIFGIMVVNQYGEGINFGQAVVRHLFDPIDNIPGLGIMGVLVASNSKNRKRIGDHVANTMVIDAKKG